MSEKCEYCEEELPMGGLAWHRNCEKTYNKGRKEALEEVGKFEIDLYDEKFIIINPEDWKKLGGEGE